MGAAKSSFCNRLLMKDSQAGDPVSIEHNGRVIRQLVLTPEGEVEEAPYTRVSGRERVLKWNEEDEPEPETVRAAVKKKLDEVFPKLEGVPMLLKPLLEISPSGPLT